MPSTILRKVRSLLISLFQKERALHDAPFSICPRPLPHLYLSEERSARCLSRRERCNAGTPATLIPALRHSWSTCVKPLPHPLLGQGEGIGFSPPQMGGVTDTWPTVCWMVCSLCHPDRSLWSGGTPASARVALTPPLTKKPTRPILRSRTTQRTDHSRKGVRAPVEVFFWNHTP